jgi:hypothetical protein
METTLFVVMLGVIALISISDDYFLSYRGDVVFIVIKMTVVYMQLIRRLL